MDSKFGGKFLFSTLTLKKGICQEIFAWRKGRILLSIKIVNATSVGSDGTTTTYTPIEHPALRIVFCIDPQNVSAFLEECARYDDEFNETNKEVSPMSVASYNLSTELRLIKIMHMLGRLIYNSKCSI